MKPKKTTTKNKQKTKNKTKRKKQKQKNPKKIIRKNKQPVSMKQHPYFQMMPQFQQSSNPS